MNIDCDFPAGNIIVDRIDGDNIELRPDLRDTEGDWFFWAFRLRGAAGRTLHFKFSGPYQGNVVAARGPAVSRDRINWTWQENDFTMSSFDTTIPADCDEIYFALAPTYTSENFERFFAELSGVKRGVLCTTRKGREVPIFSFGEGERTVLFSARHHCCESIASYSMEGVVKTLLANPPRGVRFDFIPFVDMDGSQDGDQGKNRIPRDHNRDYSGECVHVETKAIMERYGENPPEIYVDLHCPWIRGDWNENIYIVGKSDPETSAAQEKFSKIVAKFAKGGKLSFLEQDFLPFGVGWNSGANYTQGFGCCHWFTTLEKKPRLSTTFEIPYANVRGAVVLPDSARDFGRVIANAVCEFLVK